MPAAIAKGLADALTGVAVLPTADECRAYARQHNDWPVVVTQIRRNFQLMRPERLRKMRYQTDGDDIDYDAYRALVRYDIANAPVKELRLRMDCLILSRMSTPEKIAFYLTSRGVTNEVYYVAQKVARLLGPASTDVAERLESAIGLSDAPTPVAEIIWAMLSSGTGSAATGLSTTRSISTPGAARLRCTSPVPCCRRARRCRSAHPGRPRRWPCPGR